VATILGVDPGSRYTGIVVRRGDELLACLTLTRRGIDNLPTAIYLREVVYAVLRFWETHQADLIGIEAVQAPSAFQGKSGEAHFSNLDGILGTAMVVGAVEGFFPHAVEVAPARMGKAPMNAYPAELRPATGQGKGKDNKRHMRSAWDVAGASSAADRLAKAGAP